MPSSNHSNSSFGNGGFSGFGGQEPRRGRDPHFRRGHNFHPSAPGDLLTFSPQPPQSPAGPRGPSMPPRTFREDHGMLPSRPSRPPFRQRDQSAPPSHPTGRSPNGPSAQGPNFGPRPLPNGHNSGNGRRGPPPMVGTVTSRLRRATPIDGQALDEFIGEIIGENWYRDAWARVLLDQRLRELMANGWQIQHERDGHVVGELIIGTRSAREQIIAPGTTVVMHHLRQGRRIRREEWPCLWENGGDVGSSAKSRARSRQRGFPPWRDGERHSNWTPMQFFTWTRGEYDGATGPFWARGTAEGGWIPVGRRHAEGQRNAGAPPNAAPLSGSNREPLGARRPRAVGGSGGGSADPVMELAFEFSGMTIGSKEGATGVPPGEVHSPPAQSSSSSLPVTNPDSRVNFECVSPSLSLPSNLSAPPMVRPYESNSQRRARRSRRVAEIADQFQFAKEVAADPQASQSLKKRAEARLERDGSKLRSMVPKLSFHHQRRMKSNFPALCSLGTGNSSSSGQTSSGGGGTASEGGGTGPGHTGPRAKTVRSVVVIPPGFSFFRRNEQGQEQQQGEEAADNQSDGEQDGHKQAYVAEEELSVRINLGEEEEGIEELKSPNWELCPDEEPGHSARGNAEELGHSAQEQASRVEVRVVIDEDDDYTSCDEGALALEGPVSPKGDESKNDGE